MSQVLDFQNRITKTSSCLSNHLQYLAKKTPDLIGQQNQLKKAKEALTTYIYACQKAESDLSRVRRDILKGLVANFDADEYESACTTRKTDRFISDKQKSISDYTT